MNLKHLLFTVVLSTSILISIAQPQLKNTIIPAKGDKFNYDNAKVATSNPCPGNKGANVTWDFTTLTLKGTTTLIDFVDPTTTKYYGNYYNKNANATLASLNGPGVYVYYNFDNNKYVIAGYSDENTQNGKVTETLVYYSDFITMFTFPMNFKDSISDTFKSTFSDGLSDQATQDGTTKTVYDGHGTLKLPNGKTYQNVMRIRYFRDYIENSSFLGETPATDEEYLWFDANNKAPIFKYKVNKYNDKFYYILTSGPAQNISDNSSNNKLNVYPNPVNDKLIVENVKNNTVVSIYNVQGQLQISSIVNNNEVINMSNLSKGIYVLKIQSEKETITKKIVKE